MQKILPNWESKHTDAFGLSTLYMQHRLAETGLFTIEALADLIGSIPPHKYNLNTMGFDAENPEWKEGSISDVSGKEVIETIARSRMWLNIRKLESIDERYKKALDDIYTEMEDLVPGFSSFKRSMGVLVSSPKVQVFYHSDVPGQSLWQLEGEKTVYIYPNKPPYLPQKALEDIIMGRTEEDIHYTKEFDDAAEIFHLKPGEMLNWPLNGPHRVVNKDCLNISVTTEHWTSEIRKSYAVNYANGVIREKLGMNNLSNSISSPTVYPKAALALMYKQFNLNKTKAFKRMVSFEADPSSKTGMRDVPKREKEVA